MGIKRGKEGGGGDYPSVPGGDGMGGTIDKKSGDRKNRPGEPDHEWPEE